MISVFYYVLLNVGKGRLAKEGSLAPHTREKLSEITRGVTLTMVMEVTLSLVVFSQMEMTGVQPNDVTFIGVLSACKHSDW